MVLIDGKSEVQQLQLTIIPVQQIATGSAVLPCASHILAKPVESHTFLTVSFRVLAICLSDVILEGLDPIDLVGLLQRTRKHR